MLGVWLCEMEASHDDEFAYFKSSGSERIWHSSADLPPADEMSIYLGLILRSSSDSASNSFTALSDLDHAVIIVIGVWKRHVHILDISY